MQTWIVNLSLVLLLSWIPARIPLAQPSAAPFEAVELTLWPEFDRPEMLVIYRVQLGEATALPAEVRLPLPSSVEEPHAVAVRGADGSLLLTSYQRQKGEGWDIISLESDSTEVQIEFYQDLAFEGQERSFTFSWPAGFPVEDLRYEVQEPPGTTGMDISPAPDEGSLGLDGLVYFQGDLGAQAGDAAATITLRYQRSMTELTVDVLQAASAGVSPEPAAQGSASPIPLVAYILIALGGAMLLAAVVLFVLVWREKATISARLGRRVRSRPSSERTAEGAFCHHCGAQAYAGDSYCRRCGERLRQDRR
jgi:hypothetical protein